MGDYIVKKLYAAAILLLVVGGIAWGWLGMLGKNPVSQAFGKWAAVVYVLVGISAIIVLVMGGRNAFLPFLGPTVFPCAALEDKIPDNADTEVTVYVKPGAKVLYWGAEPTADELGKLKKWRKAYGDYLNAGVTTADDAGKAVLRLRKPQPYKVPMKGRLESHVHYRMCHKAGWMTQVETQMLHSEPFEDTPAVPVTSIVASIIAPELPVIADPVSGIPTAIPNLSRDDATVTAADTVMGYSADPMFGAAEQEHGEPFVAKLDESTVETDPRLVRLHATVEAASVKMGDTMGFAPMMEGTELDLAFQPSLRPDCTPK